MIYIYLQIYQKKMEIIEKRIKFKSFKQLSDTIQPDDCFYVDKIP